jgi:hypothetical protein
VCNGEAHGDFEFRFGNLKFFWIKAARFCKNWGVAAGVDVMINPMRGVGFTSPVLRMEGYF